MKTYFVVQKNLLFFFFFFSLAVVGQDEQGGAVLSFDNPVIDFGTMYTDDLPDGKIDIVFRNLGDEPLVLSNVSGCCGTRILDWPQSPVLPNESGLIQIEIRIAKRASTLSRVVTVTSNSVDNATARLRIKGKVEDRN